MKIISHRGYWIKPKEKNTLKAFERSFDMGFGTETDLRDLNNKICISHDPATSVNNLDIDSFSMLYKSYNTSLPLALNVKSDGLQTLLEEFIKNGNIEDYFFFDMSIPDTINYIRKNLNVFIRQSEYEKDLPFYQKAKGVWLDSFQKMWYSQSVVLDHLNNGKKVAIVSAELHSRDHRRQWEILKEWPFIKDQRILLCTDFPEDASKFFNS